MKDEEILIIGSNGQLGRALQQKYPAATAVDSDKLDITNKEALENYDWSKTKVIINAAAYTNVDGAEIDTGRILAWDINAVAPSYLVNVCLQNEIVLIHVSTDYVFDGTKDMHTETEKLSPISVYGESKAAGDIAVSILPSHYILRTSWVIGDGRNFVKTMLELGNKGISPQVVSDQIGRLTFTNELVKAISHLLSNQSPFGTYNVSDEGPSVSWADITREIFKLAGFTNTVTDVTTVDYYKGKENIAPRPLQSSLDLSKLKATGYSPNNWNDDLSKYIKEQGSL